MKKLLTLVIVSFAVAFGCKPGSTPDMGPGQPQAATVVLQNFSFNPNDVTVSPGQAVNFVHEDAGTQHTVNRDVTTKPGPEKDLLSFGQTYTFVVPATVPSGTNIFYHCNIHGAAGNGTTFGSGMAGVIRVK